MLELCRLQLGQILGGRMKWLVAVILLLPVLLTLAVFSAGGLDAIERELEHERLYHDLLAGGIPDTARRLVWEGEDLSLLGGTWLLTEEGLLDRGLPAARDWTIVVNDGYLILSEGQLWIDDSKKPRIERFSIRHLPPLYARADSGSDSGGDSTPASPFTVNTFAILYLFLLYPQVICLLISLFYGTSVLGHELSGKTLTYLFTRAMPRWKFVVGKYLGIIVALVVPTCLSLLVSWLILRPEGGLRVVAGLLAGTVAALLAFNALFVLFGFLVPRRAMIAALLYGVVFELVLSFVPALVNQFTITYHLRSLVVEILDIPIPREATRVIGGASPQGALLALAGITVGALAISCYLAARREYVIRDQA